MTPVISLTLSVAFSIAIVYAALYLYNKRHAS